MPLAGMAQCCGTSFHWTLGLPPLWNHSRQHLKPAYSRVYITASQWTGHLFSWLLKLHFSTTNQPSLTWTDFFILNIRAFVKRHEQHKVDWCSIRTQNYYYYYYYYSASRETHHATCGQKLQPNVEQVKLHQVFSTIINRKTENARNNLLLFW